MIKRSLISSIIWTLLDLLLILVVLPFIFVIIYCFDMFFIGDDISGLFVEIIKFSSTFSWVSCSFLFIVALVIRTMIKRQVSWTSLFCTALAGGALWLILWNVFVEHFFTFWRSLLPLIVCSVVSTTYALGKKLYSDDSLNFADGPQLDYHEELDTVSEEELCDIEESDAVKG